MHRTLMPTTAPSPTAAADALPPPRHLRWEPSGLATKVAIAANVVLVILFFFLIVWRLFFSDKDATAEESAGGSAASQAASPNASSPCSSPPRSGVGWDDLSSLPVFVHGEASVGGAGTGDKVECAVCICELKDGDTGRLLPRCGHRFHAACVDKWFRSHASCPLCRAVVGDGVPSEADAKLQADV